MKLLEWVGWLDTETWVLWSTAGLMLVLVALWLASSLRKRRPHGASFFLGLDKLQQEKELSLGNSLAVTAWRSLR